MEIKSYSDNLSSYVLRMSLSVFQSNHNYKFLLFIVYCYRGYRQYPNRYLSTLNDIISQSIF